MKRVIYNSLFAAAILLFAASCSNKTPKPDESKIVWTELPVEAIVEIARTAEERAKGLKFRDYLQKDCGMYFIMEKEEIQNFWMKDTRISLDIAFIDSANIIVSIKNMRAYDISGISSNVPAKYALEMERGWFRDKGIRTGDKAILGGDKILFYRASAADSI
jgi:uncharacterized membrane protein (UPF0127 family)